jgi:hypothetical protein
MRTTEIGDAEYVVEEENGLVYVTCEKPWSLVGMGEDVEQAKMDVRYEARIFLDAYSEEYPEGLTEDAVEMVDYMLEIFENPIGEDGNCRCSACRHERGEV